MTPLQEAAASKNLELFGISFPHTKDECQKMLKAHQDWHLENSDVASWEVAKIRAERGSLGYMAALQEAANEIKTARLRK